MSRSSYCFSATSLASLTLLLACLCWATPSYAEYRIGDICRVKGQETNELRGVGLVVGLKGTGDPDLLTTRQALARVLVNSGMELPVDNLGREDISDFVDVTNVALVIVTAKLPPTGSRQGSKVTCHVHAFGDAKSLQGGYLVGAAMTGGPGIGQSGRLPVLAHAEGPIQLLDAELGTTGIIRNGCQVSVDLTNDFFYFDVPWGTDPSERTKSEKRTQMYVDLVMTEPHASFATTARVAEEINNNRAVLGGRFTTEAEPEVEYAQALDATTVKVRVPSFYQSDPVSFIDLVLRLNLIDDDGINSRVIINERTGTVVIGEDVYFSPCVISSGEFIVETSKFVPLNLEDNAPIEGGPQQKLRDLHNALKALQAPPQVIIDIIKQLDRIGYLKGELRYAE